MMFIDSSFIIAMIVEKDQWHVRASEIAKKNVDQKKVTSDLIITEAMAIISSLKGGKIAKIMYDYIKDNYTIYTTDMNSLDIGMNTLLKYEGTISLVDSISINIMKELKILEIASFDSDFDNKKGIIRIH